MELRDDLINLHCKEQEQTRSTMRVHEADATFATVLGDKPRTCSVRIGDWTGSTGHESRNGLESSSTATSSSSSGTSRPGRKIRREALATSPSARTTIRKFRLKRNKNRAVIAPRKKIDNDAEMIPLVANHNSRPNRGAKKGKLPGPKGTDRKQEHDTMIIEGDSMSGKIKAQRKSRRVVPRLAAASSFAAAFFGCLAGVVAQSSVTIVANADMGTCTCDITANKCDPYCCCDPDCSTGVQNSGFSSDCITVGASNALESQYSCSSKSYVQEVNPRTDVSVLQDDLRNLLCVHIDNSAADGRYFDSSATTAYATYTSEVSSRSLSSYPVLSLEHVDASTASSGYTVGHLVKMQQAWTTANVVAPLTTTGALESAAGTYVQKSREWKVPLPDASGRCSDQPVPFMFDIASTSCQMESVVLSTACTTTLNAQQLSTYQVQGHNLYAAGSDTVATCAAADCVSPLVQISGCATTSATSTDTFTKPTFAGSTLSSVTAGTACTATAEELKKGKASTYTAGTSTCSNAVIGAHYTVTYTSSTKNDITSVVVQYEYADIVATSTDITFTTSVSFVYNSGTASVARSGNPGYLFGKPLLLEKCGQSTSSGCTSFVTTAAHGLPGVSLGECEYASSSNTVKFQVEQIPVNFGEDTVAGCSLSFTAAELATFCAASANEIVMLQPVPTTGTGTSQKSYNYGFSHVGAWGSSDRSNMADYVEIQASTADTTKTTTDPCEKLQTQTYEFAYAPFGEQTNPQYKITGAWAKRTYATLKHTLSDPSKKQSFPFFVNIQFVKQADTAELELNIPPRPDLPVYLPSDVFYPLTLFD
ncbi:unnamed protein product [Amoebophrya sp. A120]|nr:unnamed protein product [Amoebophrya sp. A120]|eukprot:GSA120T00005113001.1